MIRVFIGLGTNLGDRERNLSQAMMLLSERGCLVLAHSTVAETSPVDMYDQPDFLNQIVIADTALEPLELLGCCKKIEREMGRVHGVPKGPRLIDIDILLYGDTILDTDTLTIPHKAIGDRDFVLKHLIQLDPLLRDPRTGIFYSEVLNGKKKHFINT